MTTHFRLRIAAVVMFLACAFVAAHGQTATSAVVVGIVKDSTGALIPGANVELLNTGTNIAQTQITNDVGQYVFAGVLPGNYQIKVTLEGFRTATVPNLKLEVAKSYTVNVSLEVGQVAQTVEVLAEARIELQTTDAQIGNVINANALSRLPTVGRNAAELLMLQPGVTPTQSGNANTGGTVAGARSDQSTFSLDGIDITDNSVGGAADLRTVIRVPVDSIEEFKVGVTNANATFGRSAGGQIAMVGRRGTNTLAGAAYWYHQNDNLNANTWTNNRLGIREPELKDNRFGFRVGGPVLKNKTFFFTNYEGRRFPQSSQIVRLVPTDSLRQGILRYRDAAGNTVDYNLAASRLCGTAGNELCDPRGIGISPSVQALFNQLPPGNDPTAPNADGLNTIGFRSTALTPQNTEYGVLRMDHIFSPNWRFTGSYTYFRLLQTTSSQVDIRGGKTQATTIAPNRGDSAMLGLSSNFTPTFLQQFRFGFVRDRTANIRFDPTAAAAALAIPGTATSAGPVALDLAANLIEEPIDIDTQRGRTQGSNNRSFQFLEDVSWIKGKHTVQFGTNIRSLPTMHFRNDKVVGSLSSLVATLDSVVFSPIPASARPPTCGGGVTTNCLTAGDVTRWNRFYAATLGMVDNVNILMTRDGSLQPRPFGTNLRADTKLRAYEFYAQDTWRVTSSLTFSYGLTYGWQTPPKEKDGKQTFVIDRVTGAILNQKDYLSAKRRAAEQGQIFNPELAYMPINASGRKGVFDIDRNNFAPRLAGAWNPSYSSGFLGALFGDGRSVVRGGYGIVYDRLNTVQSVIIPTLGVGFAQTISVNGPLCNASSAPGRGCAPAGTVPAAAYRVGVDGAIPLPTVPAVSTPVVPRPVYEELLSFQVDPKVKVGLNHSADLTIQRELPGNFLIEMGWLGRWGRDLPQSVNFNSVPYFHKDPASGQTFAQAFDAVATALRNQQPVTPQAWFENQAPGFGGTAAVAQRFASNFIDGIVADLAFQIDQQRVRSGLLPINNLQVSELFTRTDGGRSNYHAAVFTLRKRLSQGLTTNVNYTFSKSLDQVGAVQNSASFFSSSFDPDVEYGPSFFDRTHTLNTFWTYDLPFGSGHRFAASGPMEKLLGGWGMSGVFTASSGLPLTVTQSGQVFGGGRLFSFNSAAIPTKGSGSFSNKVNTGIAGTNGVGINSDPARRGTGLNYFTNPEDAINSFRRVLLSRDGRTGRANPLRGFPNWNVDLSFGKKTTITEDVKMEFSVDMFNVLNHVDFLDPTLSLQNRANFGVVTSQIVPSNRPAGSRWIQIGFRVEF